jgi:hypothetical protein
VAGPSSSREQRRRIDQRPARTRRLITIEGIDAAGK